MFLHCWLGTSKSIWSVIILSDEIVICDMVSCLEPDASDLHVVQLMPLLPHTSLALLKSRLVLPFWCQFAKVFLVKRPVNERLLGGGGAGLVPWVGVPPNASFGFYLREL